MHQTENFLFRDGKYTDNEIEKTINDFLEKLETKDHIVVRYLANLQTNTDGTAHIFSIDLIHRPLAEKDPQRKNLKKGPQRFKSFHYPVYDAKEAKTLADEINKWFQEMEDEGKECSLSKTILTVAYPEKRISFFYRMKPKDPPKKEEEAPKES